MMHHTKFLKRCLTQPRLLLQTFLLGTLLTGCFAVMAGFGASTVSAQSLNVQKTHPPRQHHRTHRKNEDEGQEIPTAKDDDKGVHKAKGDDEGNRTSGPGDAPGGKGPIGAPVVPSAVPAIQHNNTGTDTTAAGSKNASAAPVGGGAVPIGAIPVGGGAGGAGGGGAGGAGGGGAGGAGGGGAGGAGGGAGRPGLPYTGSDPGNNPLP